VESLRKEIAVAEENLERDVLEAESTKKKL